MPNDRRLPSVALTRHAVGRVALTCGALLGFAGNSLLCRMALGAGAIDAASFTVLRLVSGALVLGLLVRARGGREGTRGAGSWPAALALAAYAGCFSFAYLRMGAGAGALILFGSVQVTMIGFGVWRGERPRPAEWAGVALAVTGLLALTVPGWAGTPDGAAVGLMTAAGVAWAAYTLLGRSPGDPLRATADNFLRAVPLGLPALLIPLVAPAGAAEGWVLTGSGVALAVTSGAVTSGLAYSLWYAALKHLSATRAAIVQLSVPALAALGGVLLLGETLTLRMAVAGAAILSGILLAVAVRPARSAATPTAAR